MGAYLDGSEIYVRGNAQDAVGDTMDDGLIVIDGCAGDAIGYAMRGGEIFVRGSVGYRAGIHMKEYKQKHPVLVVGGAAGSFLGEYQAGGTIIILGLGSSGQIVGPFAERACMGERYSCAAISHRRSYPNRFACGMRCRRSLSGWRNI